MVEYIDKQAALADLSQTHDKMSGYHPQFYNGYQTAWDYDDLEWDFCPECGRRMDGGTDNGE